MENIPVAVVGASGYSGAVLARLVASHPHFALALATSDKLDGQPLASHLRVPVAGSFASHDRALSSDARAVFLATSAEVSMKLAPAFVERGVPVVDLSGAFRLVRADAYPAWYRFEHARPDLLRQAHYGLPELFGAPTSKLVANPGCYPTASLLALAPLVREGLVDAQSMLIDAKSGVTGAGRQSKEEYSFVEVDEDVRAYRVGKHQHTPEIAQALSRFAPSSIVFTPHLMPLRRGLLATCYAKRRDADVARAEACLRDAYAGSPFVHVCPPEEATLKAVVGTNHALVGVAESGDYLIAVAAIDNLLKGAAGQAMQNMNLLFGLDGATGLLSLLPSL